MTAPDPDELARSTLDVDLPMGFEDGRSRYPWLAEYPYVHKDDEFAELSSWIELLSARQGIRSIARCAGRASTSEIKDWFASKGPRRPPDKKYRSVRPRDDNTVDIDLAKLSAAGFLRKSVIVGSKEHFYEPNRARVFAIAGRLEELAVRNYKPPVPDKTMATEASKSQSLPPEFGFLAPGPDREVRPRLRVVRGWVGATYLLPRDGTVSIGREVGNDFVIDWDASVSSSKHGSIKLVDDRWFLTDHNSTSGTRVNGIRLAAEQKYEVHHGDHVEIGWSGFVFLKGTQPG